MMKGSTKKAICLFHFMFIAELGVSLNCTGSCGNPGIHIRFPFKIKDRQPEQCGYHGFDLSCNEMGDIVLELPGAVKLNIDKIDYKNQAIYASDPEGCLLSQHSNFNSSVFHKQFKMSKVNFTIFNCSLNNAISRPRIACLSTHQYDVLAVDSEQSIDDNELLLSCTKMYDLPVQRDIRLSWSNPKCGYCEETGKQCRLRVNSSSELETECYGLPRPKKGARKRNLTIGVTTGSILLGVLVIAVYQIYSFRKSEEEYQAKVERFLDDYRAMNPTRYSHADLKKMTNQFRDELGQGAYGTVFKGKLSSEIPVAVKVLNNSSEKGEEFVNEMGTMARIHHVNVVRLIGFCADGFRRALVYEYLPNDSLQKFISSANAKNVFLGWERLHHIALGVAKGIEYLHQGCDQTILHFDIKPHNILLDNDFNPKIADFGLAKLCSKYKSAISMTTARGTVGYIAPEVFSRNFGNVSYKSDVYSFGMMVLEMVGGRKNVDDTAENGDQVYFPEWIYNLLEEGEDLRFHIEEEGDAQIAKKLAVTVSNVHEVHASAGWPKQGLRVLAAMPSVGEIGSADLCGCRFVKGKSAAQIVDEHGLDEGLSKPRQGDRLTRIGAIAEFGSVGRGSLHADANSAAQELASCTQMRIRQRRNWHPARRCEFGSTQQRVQVRGSTWHDWKLGRRTVQGMG